MDLISRLLGKGRQPRVSEAEDAARQMHAPHAPTLQSADEQAGVRRRMEAELESQRERRGRSA